jgi:hypothetical protein
VQLRQAPVETVEPIIEPPGFTLVEEDDVAFGLSLCREVHRIYGDYQETRLEATDSVLAGLALTYEMLSALGSSMRGGMPSMRIQVASAQTREMLAVLFGEDPLAKPVRGKSRARYLSVVAESTAALAAGPEPEPAAEVEAHPPPPPGRGLRRLFRRRPR